MNLAGGVGLLVVCAPVAGGALVTMNGQVLWGHPSPCVCCGVSVCSSFAASVHGPPDPTRLFLRRPSAPGLYDSSSSEGLDPP